MNKFLFGVVLITLLSFVYFLFFWNTTNDIYRDIQSNLESVMDAQQADINQFENQLSVYSDPFSIRDNAEFAKRVYLNGSLIYWNDDRVLPSYTQLRRADSLYIFQDNQGISLIKRKQVETDAALVEIYSVIPLSTDYSLKNQYLYETFNSTIFKNYQVKLFSGSQYHLTYKGIHLMDFSIYSPRRPLEEKLILTSLLIALLCGYLLMAGWWKRSFSSPFRILIGTGLLLASLRLLILFVTQQLDLSWNVFDPVYFSSGFGESMGELFLNMLFVLLFFVECFRVYQKQNQSNQIDRKWILLGVPVVFITIWLSYQLIWMILENSQVSLDINESIFFDEFRVFTFAVVVWLGGINVIWMSMAIQIIHRMHMPIYWIWGTVLGLYLILATLLGAEAFVYLLIPAVYILLCIHLRLGLNVGELRYKTFLYFLITVAAFSFTEAFAVYKHSEYDDLISKERFADRLLIKNDILGELYLHEIIGEIESDPYIRSRLISRLLARQNIREKIKRQFLTTYFSKYDINVYLFDVNGNSLQMDQSEDTYEIWEAQYHHDSLSTDYEKIYFIQDPNIELRNKYVCFLDIRAFDRVVGHIVLDLTLKKYIPTSVFPELLLESRYYIGNKNEFDYAVYKNEEIQYKQGRYGFEQILTAKDLEREALYQRGIEKQGGSFLAIRMQDDRVIVVVSDKYELEAIFNSFSWFFLIQLLVIGFGFILLQMVVTRQTFTLSTKIQVYVGLSLILPMMIVMVALINTLNRSYREEIDRDFQTRSFNIAENLIDDTEQFIRNLMNVDDYTNVISEAGAFVQNDINIYNTRGRLITASQPEIFRLGLKSNLMNPRAFRTLRHPEEQSLILEESIGMLEYKNSYTALRSYQDGRVLAYLSLPYFDSKNQLRRQQVEVFGSIISVFTIIFILAIFLGQVLIASLVVPLRKIGDSLRAMSLQEENTPIAYTAVDEIGSLVKEYNNMLLKLEANKEALAVSQKESAWKEIAQQVAHEIKNPLTPMRLKIQQMMRSFKPEEKHYQTALTLIEQVDSLSSIADSFSEFAKMPVPTNERLELHGLIDKVLGLYQSESVQIETNYLSGEVFVKVDPKIFSRIFTNIVLNAIQSQEGQSPYLMVETILSGAKVVISFHDKGQGIGEEDRDKVFTPYFSTKAKGSGIGLAVAKKGIENAGGNIWFESKKGEGTVFFISLPVVAG